jgi:hypothetical protein
MPFVAGNDIDAHCPRCGRDRTHTVMVVHNGLVQEVRCRECKEVHPYKRPHVEKRPAPAKPAKARPRQPRQSARAAPKVQGPPAAWEEKVIGCDREAVRPYTARESFAVDEVLSHPKFGLGVVTELQPDGKIDVAFKEGIRRLVHARAHSGQNALLGSLPMKPSRSESDDLAGLPTGDEDP